MSNSKHEISLAQIQFPTDSITIGQLKERFPECFSWKTPDQRGLYASRNRVSSVLMDAMEIERHLAIDAFDSEIGHSLLADQSYARKTLVSELSDAYQELGVTNGEAETAVLAGKIESQARRQVSLKL
ncbi:MAG: hypothetical protein AAFX06_14160 [Planctomycetota bacterium]